MEENLELHHAKRHPKEKEIFRNDLSNRILAKSPSLFLDLSENLLNKIDLFLINTNLSTKQQKELVKIFEDTYGEGYLTSMIS